MALIFFDISLATDVFPVPGSPQIIIIKWIKKNKCLKNQINADELLWCGFFRHTIVFHL